MGKRAAVATSRQGSNASRNGATKEQAIKAFKQLGFEFFTKTEPRHKPDRYIVTNWQHSPLYHGGSFCKKEALIVDSFWTGKKSLDISPDGLMRILVEVKGQDGPGSCDEKIPYVLETFRSLDVRNLILLLDGKWWATGRGEGAYRWAKAQESLLRKEGRWLRVVRGLDDYFELTGKLFR